MDIITLLGTKPWIELIISITPGRKQSLNSTNFQRGKWNRTLHNVVAVIFKKKKNIHIENFAPTSISCFRALDETTLTVKTKQDKTKTFLCSHCKNLSISPSKPYLHVDSDTLHHDLFCTMTTCDCLTKTLFKNTRVFWRV